MRMMGKKAGWHCGGRFFSTFLFLKKLDFKRVINGSSFCLFLKKMSYK